MAQHTNIPKEINFKKDIKEEVRPWGKFRSFPYQKTGCIKIITVNPGESLSLQYHKKRSEFWVILDSGLEITLGEKTWSPQENEEIFIPPQTPHRVRCWGEKQARIMELWLGQSEESDIVRLQDNYGRIREIKK